MATNTAHAQTALDPPPVWWVTPGETDWLAWAAIIFVALAIYLVIVLYAKFDHWAEHQAHGTPLAKTIPTMLAIALLYEIFPLDHFHILLPLSAIVLALAADWMAHQENKSAELDDSALLRGPESDA